MSFTQLGRILAGEKVMTMDEFGAICAALGLDPEDVFRDAVESLAAHERAGLRVVDGGAGHDGIATSGAGAAGPDAQEPAPPLDAAARRVADRPEYAAAHRWDDVGEEPQEAPPHDDRGD